MFARGLWSEGVPGDGETESFEISAMFLPYGWMPWIALMKQYEKAKAKLEEGERGRDDHLLQHAPGAVLGADEGATKYDELMARADGYKLGTVPAAARSSPRRSTRRLTASSPRHGWGEGMEGWVVDYQVIHGSPAEIETWQKGDELLKGATGTRAGAHAEHHGRVRRLGRLEHAGRLQLHRATAPAQDLRGQGPQPPEPADHQRQADARRHQTGAARRKAAPSCGSSAPTPPRTTCRRAGSAPSGPGAIHFPETAARVVLQGPDGRIPHVSATSAGARSAGGSRRRARPTSRST
jgi:hypothetical protein